MDPPDDRQLAQATRGAVLTAISDGIVALLKDFYGRGPTRAKQPDMLCEVFVLAPTDLFDDAAMEAAGIEPVRPEQIGAAHR